MIDLDIFFDIFGIRLRGKQGTEDYIPEYINNSPLIYLTVAGMYKMEEMIPTEPREPLSLSVDLVCVRSLNSMDLIVFFMLSLLLFFSPAHMTHEPGITHVFFHLSGSSSD